MHFKKVGLSNHLTAEGVRSEQGNRGEIQGLIMILHFSPLFERGKRANNSVSSESLILLSSHLPKQTHQLMGKRFSGLSPDKSSAQKTSECEHLGPRAVWWPLEADRALSFGCQFHYPRSSSSLSASQPD